MSVPTFVLTFSLVLTAAFSGSAMAQIRVLSTESAFGSAVISPKVASFDALPTGYLSSLVTQLNGVSLTINFLGAAPIYAAGSFGNALTTNYLSAAVKDGNDNNVFLEFPANTRAAGMRVVTVNPVTFTATSQSGETKTILLSTGATTSTAGFVGFSDPQGIKSIRVSSPATNPNTPIVNIGNIFFATELAALPVGVPLFSPLALLMLAGSLVLVVGANQRRQARA